MGESSKLPAIITISAARQERRGVLDSEREWSYYEKKSIQVVFTDMLF